MKHHASGKPVSSNRSRRALTVTLLVLLLSAAMALPSVAGMVRQPYIQQGTPTSMTIVWMTDVATDSVVNFGTQAGVLNQTETNPSSVLNHVVTINGLVPGTKYYYATGSSSGLPADQEAGGTPAHFFVTHPPEGSPTPFTIWVIGDTGDGSADQAAVRDSMLAKTAGDPPDLVIHVGDIAYNSGTESEFTNWHFAMYDEIFRNTVFWPSYSNHDGQSSDSATQTGPYYDAFVVPTNAEAGGVPSGTEAYYSFNYANVHFVVLESYEVSRAATGPMADWIAADLAANDQLWTIAYFHHPPYSKGTHNSDTEFEMIEMRENLTPILEAGGADLILSGHSHTHERSYMINGTYGTPTPSFATLLADGVILDSGDGDPLGDGAYTKSPLSNRGTVYHIEGTGGRSVGCNNGCNHPIMHNSAAEFGSALIYVDGNTLTVDTLRASDGAITDTYSIVQGSSAVGSEVFTEDFESGYSGLATIGSHPDWFDAGGGPVPSSGSGTAGSVGLDAAGGIFVWTAHPFDWNAPDFYGFGVGMDFKTDAGGTLDDDRAGWMIEDDDNSSDHICGVQVDPDGGGLLLEGYWDGPAANDLRPLIAPMPVLSGDTWYRLRAEFTKLGDTAARVEASLFELDANGYPIDPPVAAGVIPDTSALGDDGPNSKYFLGNPLTGEIWPAYKNHTAAGNSADNAFAQIFSTQAIVSDWVAYNDLHALTAAAGDGNAEHVTTYDYKVTGGALKNIADGSDLAVTMTGSTFDGDGGVCVDTADSDGVDDCYDPQDNGAAAAVGTDAYDVFAGVVDLQGVHELDETVWDNVLTFENLDPNKIYTIELTTNRDNLPYDGARFTRVTIEGADTFVNESTDGVVVHSEDSVSFSTGYNAGNGYVARWTNVTAADGIFSIKSEWDATLGTPAAPTSPNSKGYAMSAFRLEQSGPGVPAECTVDADCDDGNLCTADACSAEFCQHVALTCDVGETCEPTSGDCLPTPVTTTFQEGGAYAGTEDTFIAEADPDADNGGLDVFGWDTDDPNGSGQAAVALIRFSGIFGDGPGQIPAGSQITSASLSYTVGGGAGGPEGDSGNLHEMLIDWNESASWNNLGGTAGPDAGTDYAATPVAVLPANPAGPYSVDVTSSLQAWSADPASQRGWIVMPTGTNGVDVRSSEHSVAGERPTLSVTHAPVVDLTEAGDVIIAGFQASGSPEWIELFNTTSRTISLEGMNLTVRVDVGTGDGIVDVDWDLLSYEAPDLTGLEIAPHSFFLVSEAAGADLQTNLDLATGEGGTAERAISIELAFDGLPMDYLLYGRHDGSSPAGELPPGDIPFDGFGAITPVPAGSEWRYLDDGSDQGSAWTASGFDDSGWSSGDAQLGYAEGDEATLVNCGPSAPTCNSGNFITTYFRHSFEIADASRIDDLTLELVRDDGAIVYLNGVEVARDNMPGDPIDYATPASAAVGGADESTFFSFPISPTGLVDGVNVLAVEIHQSSDTSSDISFDLRLDATASGIRSEVIRTVSGAGASFEEGATQRLLAVDLFAGSDVQGFYTDEGSLPGSYAPGPWTSQHSTTGGTPRDASLPPVAEPCQEGLPCDDGDACTTDDVCVVGVCVGGPATDCDDGNECTDDSCDPASGCINDPNTNPCDDGLMCTIGDTCGAGICAGIDDCLAGFACDPGTGTCELAPTVGLFQQGAAGYVGTQDTFLQEAAPAAANGNLEEWEWDDDDPSGSGNRNFGLIRFDGIFGTTAGLIPPGSRVLSATLSYNVFDEGVDGDVREMLVDWDETGNLNSICEGSCDEGADYGVTSQAMAGAGLPLGSHAIDVTASIQSWVNRPGDNLGWILVPPSTPGATGGGAQIRSSEYPVLGDRPTLSVTYLACELDGDCDDGSPCTAASCEADGSCSYVPANDGAACDDGDASTINDTCSTGVCVGAPAECGTVIFDEDFEGYAAGDDPPDWVDTAAGSLSPADDFEIFEVDGETVFGTSSSAVNIHTHLISAESETWSDYTLSGRGRVDGAGWGVTILSDFVDGDVYYRLRNGSFLPSLHLSPHGTTQVCSGSDVGNTGFTPTPGAWFRFKVQVEDDGSQTFIRAKAWADATPEPADWQTECIDSNPATRRTSGTIGFWSMAGGGRYWDDLRVDPNTGSGGSCDDGNVCNGFEACQDGVCVPGTPLACDDGDACNGLETCDPVGGCQPGPPVDCDDGNPCTADSCDPAGGCVNEPLPAGASCGDGDVCNGDETCDAGGTCQSGTFLTCDDGNVCTGLETCDPVSGCQSGTPLVCGDGDVCNGSEVCDPIGGCQPGTPLECDDGDLCNGVETCDPAGGCESESPVDCSDGDPCTADSCDPTTGTCYYTPIAGCEADVRVYPVATLIDPTTTADTSAGPEPPDSASFVPAGEPYWIEIWATDSGATNTGLASVYVDLSFCSEVVAEEVDPGGVFTTLAGGSIGSSLIEDFGGSATPDGDPSNDGVGPNWVRVGFLRQRAGEGTVACGIRLWASAPEPRVATTGRGLVPWGEVELGSIVLSTGRSDPGSVNYDLDGDGFVGPGDLTLFFESWAQVVPPADSMHDFDCDGFVGDSDLVWFETGWLKAITDLSIQYSPQCP